MFFLYRDVLKLRTNEHFLSSTDKNPFSSAKSSMLTATKLALAGLLIGSLSPTVCTDSNLAS